MQNRGNDFYESTVCKMARAILRNYPDSKCASHVLDGLRAGDLGAVAPFDLVPFGDYDLDPSVFAVEYMAYNLLRKCADLPGKTDDQRRTLAIEKFCTTEKVCSLQNKKGGFHSGYSAWRGDPLDRTLEAAFFVAREKISRLLGPLDWNEVSASFGYSGGASTGLSRKHGDPFYKFSGKPEVTRQCGLLAICAIHHSPLWRDRMEQVHGKHSDPFSWVTIVDGSRITTVPKTATIDRVIAIEPDLNMFCQKGLGAVIRKRLLKVGIDLNDQSRNQQLAKIGSGSGCLATIDLSSASDSISLELCRQLLPHDWFSALAMTRCDVGELPDGSSIRFEKISSMGNGYTFELESLLFWALTAAACSVNECKDDRIGIYGDDIICHASYGDYLVDLLGACGFTTNAEKTFLSGPFRESCGKHFYLGCDVSPFSIKSVETITGDCTDMLHVRNSFLAWHERTQPLPDRKLVGYLTKCVPAAHQLPVPVSFGLRAGLHGVGPTGLPRVRHLSGWRVRYLCYKRVRFVPHGYSAYLAGIHTKSFTGSGVAEPFGLEVGEKVLSFSKTIVSTWD